MKEEKLPKISREAWYVAFLFFLFMLLHNTDKFLISPLLSAIQSEFGLTYTQLGAIQTGSVLVAVLFMPFWGYTFDKYARPFLVSLAGAIWSLTTIFSTFSKNYIELLITRSLTGIDNEATSGIVSFLGDYFPPEKRATAVGLVYTSNGLGTILGVVIGTVMGAIFGWRAAFLVTATPGLILAALILLSVKDKPRGATEPELVLVKDKLKDTFSRESLLNLFKRKSVILLFTQGFFGVFPWQILSYWLLLYMEVVRGFNAEERMIIMIVALLVMVLGNLVSGIASDFSFKKSMKGRMIFSSITVAIGLILFDLTIYIKGGFTAMLILGALTAFFIPMAGPSVSASIQDVSLPEVRSSALSIQVFFENVGSAFAPVLTGYLADVFGLEPAILIIITVTWTLCSIFLGFAALTIPKDIEWKKRELELRASKYEA
ncbi:MAG: MFS transporter [Thermoproteota archaeon]|nr:MFS transporter [Candidatus Brockarchaeota archaeon]